MSMIKDKDAEIVSEMRTLVEQINENLQKLKGPITTNIYSTKIRTLDSRFIYHHDFIAYRSKLVCMIGRANRESDESIVQDIKCLVAQLNKRQLELSDGVCVDLDAISLQSESLKRVQHYNLTAYYKVLI